MTSRRAAVYVAVVGAGTTTPDEEQLAEELGSRLARAGAIVVCGGLGGVMAAACRGARSTGGTTVGILPGTDRREANAWVTVALPTGLGELRNGLVVSAADVVVAVGGEHGTLSEIALALKAGIPVVGLGTWSLVRPGGEEEGGITKARNAAEAADLALRLGTPP